MAFGVEMGVQIGLQFFKVQFSTATHKIATVITALFFQVTFNATIGTSAEKI